MADKSKQRAKQYAQQHGISHQEAVNRLRRPLKDLLNRSEREVELRLEGAAAENGARVYSKVRFADVANISNSGISDESYRFALQCHLDFVVTDSEHKPLFALEYDGEGHDSHSDTLKNALCERFGLPLARVTHRHLQIFGRGLNTVGWLVELEFAYRALAEAQENGQIPADEPIDPFTIFSWSRNNRRFPLSFMLALTGRTLPLYLEKRLPNHHVPFFFVVGDGDRANAVASLCVAKDRFLFARETLYLARFGVSASEAARELAMATLGAKLTKHLRGEDVTSDGRAVYEHLLEVAELGAFQGGGWGGSGSARTHEDFGISHESIHGTWHFRHAHCSTELPRAMTRIVPPSYLVQ